MDKTDFLRIRQFSTFLPTIKQEVEPIETETGGESTDTAASDTMWKVHPNQWRAIHQNI